jgi:hypothetical protein
LEFFNFDFSKVKCKWQRLKDLKEDLKDDYDVNDLEMGTLAQVLRPLVGSISTSIGLFFF